ncbi:hypothetical protein LSAT2_008116 [Lamellibrachia satsuma]|nr:hypothetical protein LSAT2_008116 [Lamellibrachia satsuma]
MAIQSSFCQLCWWSVLAQYRVDKMKILLVALSVVASFLLTESGAKATRREITCFTFDNGFNGMFYEWVKVSNVVRVSTGCKYGSCAFFGGLNSSLEIPRFALAYSSNREFSVSFWYRRTSETPAYLIGNGQCGDDPSITAMGYFHGDVEATLHTTQGSHAGKVRVSILQWHHMVITYNGTKMWMYVDNTLASQGNLTGRLYNSRCSLSIGAKPVNSSPIIGYLRAYIDQMCVYRTSLAAADVNLLYNDPSTVLLP